MNCLRRHIQLFLCFCFALIAHLVQADIFYRELHISGFCQDGLRTEKLEVSDSKSIAIIRAYAKNETCEVARNCSLTIRAPENQGIVVTPLRVDIEHNVGSLSVLLDDHMIWYWDKKWSPSNDSQPEAAAAINGTVEITFETQRKASTWRHADFEILVTAFIPLESEAACPSPFYFDCGNRRCIREALRCDAKNNCGDNEDERNCGFDTVSVIVLVSLSAFCIIFFVGVLFLQNRQGLLRVILKKNPRIVIKSVD